MFIDIHQIVNRNIDIDITLYTEKTILHCRGFQQCVLTAQEATHNYLPWHRQSVCTCVCVCVHALPYLRETVEGVPQYMAVSHLTVPPSFLFS